MRSKISVSPTCFYLECVLLAIALMFGKVKVLLPKVLLGCGADRSLFAISHPPQGTHSAQTLLHQESLLHSHAHLIPQNQRGGQGPRI